MGNIPHLADFQTGMSGYYDVEKLSKQSVFTIDQLFKKAAELAVTTTFHVNMQDFAKEFTLLHYAVIDRNKKLVKYLLKVKSANTNIIPKKTHFDVFNRVNPLVFAIMNDDYDIAKLLIKASKIQGNCEEMINYHSVYWKNGKNLLGVALEKNFCSEKIMLLLVKNGCNVNHKDLGGAGILAQRMDHSKLSLDFIKELHLAGFDFNNIDEQRRTIFHYSSIFRNEDVCEYLIKNKCVDLNTSRLEYGSVYTFLTAFGNACHGKIPGFLINDRHVESRASEKICQLMLDHGANPFDRTITKVSIPALKLIGKMYASEDDYNTVMALKRTSLPTPPAPATLAKAPSTIAKAPTPTAPTAPLDYMISKLNDDTTSLILAIEESLGTDLGTGLGTGLGKEATADSLKEEKSTMDKECIVCFEPMDTASQVRVSSYSSSSSPIPLGEKRHIVVTVPCGHAVMCSACALRIKECPKCRTSIDKSYRLFLEN